MESQSGRAKRVWLFALVAALVCAAPAAGAGGGDSGAGSVGPLNVPDHGLSTRDVRTDAEASPAVPVSAAAARAQASIRESLGNQGVLQLDPVTGTPRVVAKLNGFLTSPSDAAPRAIALGYLREHATAFGLDRGDISSLRLTREYTDVHGTTHLIWAQVFNGIQAMDNGVYANVDENGRLINVMGSPVPDLAVRTTRPDISARGALTTALGNAGVPSRKVPEKRGTAGADGLTNFAGGTDQARLVLFTESPGVTKLAWRVTADASSTELYDYVIDAATGRVLYRTNTVDFAASGRVWEYAPNLNSVCPGCGAAAGAQTLHPFPDAWNTQASKLQGTNAHVYTDVNDDDQPDTPGQAAPGGSCPATNCVGDITPNQGSVPNQSWNYSFVPNPGGLFDPNTFTGEEGLDCGSAFPQCSWYLHDPNFSGPPNNSWGGWSTNVKQNSTQVYWFVNNFHDWLQNTPSIGFNAASGNFQGADAVQAQTFDGAGTEAAGIVGTPDDNHINNANMSTQADGIPPKMQMYLFYDDGSTDVQTNGGDDASVIYHEYTHGLSNRLITDPAGTPALRSFQARAMGEGWSDWYALDYLEGNNLDEDDTSLDGQMNMAVYTLGGDIHSLRSQGLDCEVPTNNASDCPGNSDWLAGGHTGGYTLGDMGQARPGGPEFHSDGEIWAETLWDLRHNAPANGFNVNQIRTIVTDGMRLSPPDPSMIDERNAILQATKTDFPGDTSFYNFVWQTFAHRGMGFFASDQGSADTSPTPSTALPPSCPPCGTLTGKVTDPDSGAPVAGATIQSRGSAALVATTNSNGVYTVNNLPPTTYQSLVATKPGYTDAVANSVVISANTTTPKNFTMRRDWAAVEGGAAITSATPPDYTSFGCGPKQGFDLSQGTGWGSDSPSNGSSGTTGVRSVVIHLPKKLDIKQFQMDPGATCGDPANAALQNFTVQTRTSSTGAFSTAWSNTNALPQHSFTAFPVTRPGVTDVKLIMQSNRGNPGFMDMSELMVFGKPSDVTKPVIGSVTIKAGQTVRSIIANGFKITSHLSEAGTEKGVLKIGATKAQQLGIPRQIGSGTLAFTAAGTKTMTMNLTQTAKNKLKNQNNLAVTATLNATDKAGNKATPVSKSTTLPH
jgi:extracellular elastinolytic metalloproteinase